MLLRANPSWAIVVLPLFPNKSCYSVWHTWECWSAFQLALIKLLNTFTFFPWRILPLLFWQCQHQPVPFPAYSFACKHFQEPSYALWTTLVCEHLQKSHWEVFQSHSIPHPVSGPIWPHSIWLRMWATSSWTSELIANCFASSTQVPWAVVSTYPMSNPIIHILLHGAGSAISIPCSDQWLKIAGNIFSWAKVFLSSADLVWRYSSL